MGGIVIQGDKKKKKLVSYNATTYINYELRSTLTKLSQPGTSI